MKIGPKYKIARRLGDPSIFSKTAGAKFALRQSRKTYRPTRRRTASDYATRLLERQKTRFSYGLTEHKLAQLVRLAQGSSAGDPINVLYQSLERRLDNVVYRLGFAPSRLAARQLVSHGHISVGGRRINIPSFQIRVNDQIAIRPASVNKKVFAGLTERLKDLRLPAWLTLDNKTQTGKIKALPKAGESEAGVNLGLVIDLYSRV